MSLLQDAIARQFRSDKPSREKHTADELKAELVKELNPTPKRTIVSVSEVRLSENAYLFPTDLKIRFGNKDFKFSEPIQTNEVITIIKPQNLSDQVKISKNFGGKFGRWCKKGGNAKVEIGGLIKEKQIHWYENEDGSIAGVKIKL